LEVLLSHNLHS